MKKKFLGLTLVVMSCLMLSACTEEGSESSESEVVSEVAVEELKDMDLSLYLELGDYSNIEVYYEIVEVLEEDVQAQMEYSFETEALNAGLADTSRAVALGDWADIDFIGYLDGEAFEGGTGTGYDLEIGSGSFIPGFEEGLIGVMPGTTVELPLTFPADYGHADLAGQDVIFEVTVNHVLPEMTDESVAALESKDFTTVAELEAYARELVQQDVDDYNFQNVVSLAMQQIMERTTYNEIPESLIEQQMAVAYSNIYMQLQSLSAPFDVNTYLEQILGTTLEAIALEQVKERLVIQAIANEQGIVVSDQDLDTQISLWAMSYGYTNEQMLQYMGMDRAYFRENMCAAQVYDYIYDITVNTAVSTEGAETETTEGDSEAGVTSETGTTENAAEDNETKAE